MLEADFWQDKANSKKIIKEKKLYEDLINSYETSIKKLDDLDDLNKLAIEENNLSIQKEDLPWNEWKPFRSIKIDGEELEFSTGFTELHNISYKEILKGNGFTLSDVEPTIKLIEKIRQ